MFKRIKQKRLIRFLREYGTEFDVDGGKTYFIPLLFEIKDDKVKTMDYRHAPHWFKEFDEIATPLKDRWFKNMKIIYGVDTGYWCK